MICTDLEVWAREFQEMGKTMQVLDILNEWFCKKLGDLQATKLCGTFAEIGEQVKLGESNNYNCDKYEDHMRVLRHISEYIGAEKTKEQIDWFNMMPFDFPSIEPESLLGDSEEILQGKMDYNSTLQMQKKYSLFLKISNTSVTVKKTTKPEEVDVPPIKGS